LAYLGVVFGCEKDVTDILDDLKPKSKPKPK
jgi:hypothetical protein